MTLLLEKPYVGGDAGRVSPSPLAIAERGEKERTPAANLLGRGADRLPGDRAPFTTMLLIFSIVLILRQAGRPP